MTAIVDMHVLRADNVKNGVCTSAAYAGRSPDGVCPDMHLRCISIPEIKSGADRAYRGARREPGAATAPWRAAPLPYGSRPNQMAESPAPATTSTRAAAANANVTSWVSWV